MTVLIALGTLLLFVVGTLGAMIVNRRLVGITPMSWWTDLPSGLIALGVLGAGAPAAGTAYAVGVALERDASDEARKEIAHHLKDVPLTSWRRYDYLIKKLFDITFGARHFSLKCIGRSMAASILVVAAMTLVSFVEGKLQEPYGPGLRVLPPLLEMERIVSVVFLTLFVSDYLFNNRRLLGPIGNIAPAEAEDRYYAAQRHEIALAA